MAAFDHNQAANRNTVAATPVTLDPSRTPAVVYSVPTGGIAFTIVQVGHFNGLHRERSHRHSKC